MTPYKMILFPKWSPWKYDYRNRKKNVNVLLLSVLISYISKCKAFCFSYICKITCEEDFSTQSAINRCWIYAESASEGQMRYILNREGSMVCTGHLLEGSFEYSDRIISATHFTYGVHKTLSENSSTYMQSNGSKPINVQICKSNKHLLSENYLYRHCNF